MKRAGSLNLLAALALSTLACGGSSSGSDLVASFTPDQAAPTAGSVTLAAGATSGDIVTVLVRITDVPNVFGASFDLTFDAARAAFVGFSPGTALEQGGHTPTYQVGVPESGRLVAVVTRTGGAGTAITGSLSLVALRFRVLESATSRLDFEAQALFDDQVPPQPLAGISWFGGSLIGR